MGQRKSRGGLGALRDPEGHPTADGCRGGATNHPLSLDQARESRFSGHRRADVPLQWQRHRRGASKDQGSRQRGEVGRYRRRLGRGDQEGGREGLAAVADSRGAGGQVESRYPAAPDGLCGEVLSPVESRPAVRPENSPGGLRLGIRGRRGLDSHTPALHLVRPRPQVCCGPREVNDGRGEGGGGLLGKDRAGRCCLRASVHQAWLSRAPSAVLPRAVRQAGQPEAGREAGEPALVQESARGRRGGPLRAVRAPGQGLDGAEGRGGGSA